MPRHYIRTTLSREARGVDVTDPLWLELSGRYRPERPLGAGGMAEVWLVHDERHGRLVALKVLGEHLSSALGQDRFKREIAVLARLQHPNILSLIDSGENGGRMWYVTPFIEGESLRDRLNREEKLDIPEALRLGGELLDALGYAHRSGVVHRDIKPENVLLSQGHALLADFGIARVEGKDRLTATGLSVGTPSYMSPEQVAGAPAGAPSDLYSMGCVLFECLTGQPPFTGADSRAVMAKHVMDPVPSLRARRPNVPEGVERVVARALEKDPKDRWPDAAAFARALHEPTDSKTSLLPSEIGRARPRGRRRAVVVAGAVVVIAAAVGTVLLWRSSSRPAIGPDVPLRQVTFRGDVCDSKLSPDGRYIAYFAGPQFWLLDLDRDRAWPVSDTLPHYPSTCQHWPQFGWTEDGSGYAWAGGASDSTYLASTNGEKARAVGARALAGDSLWSRGGSVAKSHSLEPDDTTPRVSLRRLGNARGRVISSARLGGIEFLSPDGSRAFMYVQGRPVLVDVDSGSAIPLDSGAARRRVLGWSADSRAVYMTRDSSAGLLRVELDRDRLRPTGRSAALLQGAGRQMNPPGIALWRNRISLQKYRYDARLLIGRLAPGGRRPGLTVEELATGSLVPKSAEIGPSNDRVFFIAAADSADVLFEMPFPGGTPRKVARLDGGGLELRVSPDGSAAVVASRVGPWFVARLVDVRTGSTRTLSGWRSKLSIGSTCPKLEWDPSGRSVLAYSPREGKVPPSIVRMNAVTGGVDSVRADSTSDADTVCLTGSPDGAWVAVKNWRRGIVLLSLAGDPERVLPKSRGGPIGWLNPHAVVAMTSWADSSEVWLHDLAGGKSKLGSFPYSCSSAAVSRDGSMIVCIASRETTDVWIADDFDPYFRPAPVPARRK